MSLVADALQPHSIAGLMSLAGNTGSGGISELLVKSSGGFDLDFDDASQSFSLDFRDSQAIVPAIGADCSRFASAAFQSITPIASEIVNKDSLAWSMIKLYYSAFYAGHSLIRILGESCSYLDHRHVARVIAVGSAIGKVPKFRIDGGLYHCKSNRSATVLSFVRARGSVGGAHESFWAIFRQCIRELTQDVLRGPLVSAEAVAVFTQLQALEQILAASGPGSHGALSVVRNDLQYKHSFGVWFPVKVHKRERERLGRLAAQWQRDPMSVDLTAAPHDPLSQFTIACAFITSVCRCLLCRIVERSAVGARCFACFGPISFLRTAGLAT